MPFGVGSCQNNVDEFWKTTIEDPLYWRHNRKSLTLAFSVAQLSFFIDFSTMSTLNYENH